jgi:NADPH:quinone reductase-like Zn-dependent oxidoreductase
MKVLCSHKHGSREAIGSEDAPDPEPREGEVLIRVKACALNHLDIWVCRGWPGLDLDLPHWGGSDMAGTVAGFGPGVTGWSAVDADSSRRH